MDIMTGHILTGQMRDAFPDVQHPFESGQSVQSFLEDNPETDLTILGTPPTKPAYSLPIGDYRGQSFASFWSDLDEEERPAVGKPFASIQQHIGLQRGLLEENRHSVIPKEESKPMTGYKADGKRIMRTREDDAKIKDLLKAVRWAISTKSDEMKQILLDYGHDKSKYSPEVREKFEGLNNEVIHLSKNLWSYRGDPLVGAFLARTMEGGGWADTLLADDNFTTRTIEDGKLRAKGELDDNLMDMLNAEWEMGPEQHIWVDWRTPHPVDHPDWIRMEDLDSKSRSKSEEPLTDEEEEELEGLKAKIDREGTERFDWLKHDAISTHLLRLIQN